MVYPELAALDSTRDQHEALAFEWATLLNAMTPEQLLTAPRTPGELLAKWVTERLLEDVELQRIGQVRQSRIMGAVQAAIHAKDDQTLRAIAGAARVRHEIDPPSPPVLPGQSDPPRRSMWQRVRDLLIL